MSRYDTTSNPEYKPCDVRKHFLGGLYFGGGLIFGGHFVLMSEDQDHKNSVLYIAILGKKVFL